MASPSKTTVLDPVRVGISIRALDGGRFSGDQAGVWRDDDVYLVCIVDGLGHGKPAEEAARAAIDCVGGHRDLALTKILQRCDETLRGSRGAAIGLARIDVNAASMDYVAVGNTRAALISQRTSYLGAAHGIVGEGLPNIFEEQISLGLRDVLAFWTDGLPETLTVLPSKLRRSTNAQAMADQLVHQYGLKEDDAGVVFLRWDARVS